MPPSPPCPSPSPAIGTYPFCPCDCASIWQKCVGTYKPVDCLLFANGGHLCDPAVGGCDATLFLEKQPLCPSNQEFVRANVVSRLFLPLVLRLLRLLLPSCASCSSSSVLLFRSRERSASSFLLIKPPPFFTSCLLICGIFISLHPFYTPPPTHHTRSFLLATAGIVHKMPSFVR
jgi:hypothetical protein